MKIVGLGRLANLCANPRFQPRLVSWLAEMGDAHMSDMDEITERFASARPTGPNCADFALVDGVVVEALFSFKADTVLIRAARVQTVHAPPAAY